MTSCGHNGSGKVRVYTACTYDVEIGDHIVVSGTTLYNYEFSVIAISANTYFDVNYTYSGSDSNPGEWEHKILSEDDVEDNMNEDWVDPTYYTYYDDVRRFRNYGELNITLENTYQEGERVYQSLVVDENYLYCVSDFHAMVYAIEDDELTFIDDFYYVGFYPQDVQDILVRGQYIFVPVIDFSFTGDVTFIHTLGFTGSSLYNVGYYSLDDLGKPYIYSIINNPCDTTIYVCGATQNDEEDEYGIIIKFHFNEEDSTLEDPSYEIFEEQDAFKASCVDVAGGTDDRYNIFFGDIGGNIISCLLYNTPSGQMIIEHDSYNGGDNIRELIHDSNFNFIYAGTTGGVKSFFSCDGHLTYVGTYGSFSDGIEIIESNNFIISALDDDGICVYRMNRKTGELYLSATYDPGSGLYDVFAINDEGTIRIYAVGEAGIRVFTLD